MAQDLVAAGLSCLVHSLHPWKGFTLPNPEGPTEGSREGGRILEIYLQRWPADKKVHA